MVKWKWDLRNLKGKRREKKMFRWICCFEYPLSIDGIIGGGHTNISSKFF